MGKRTTFPFQIFGRIKTMIFKRGVEMNIYKGLFFFEQGMTRISTPRHHSFHNIASGKSKNTFGTRPLLTKEFHAKSSQMLHSVINLH